MTLECPQIEAGYTEPRRPSPPLNMVTTLTHTMTRTQANAAVEPLMRRIQEVKWQPALNDKLASKLTVETVAVLPASTKTWLATWATQAGKPMILERLQKCTEDKIEHQWAETQVRASPALWSTTSPAEALLDNLFELTEHPDLNKEVARQKLKAATASLRYCLFKMEETAKLKAKADAMNEINALQDTIKLAIKEEMQSFQQGIDTIKLAVEKLDKHGALASANATNSMDGIQDIIKLAIKEEMERFQQSIEKGTTKRTHEEAFSNTDSHSGEPSEPTQDGAQSKQGHPSQKARPG